jgi:hypothetical protein
MKSDLITLDIWFGLNSIKMNVLKTNFILFKGDEQAEPSKFLGLQIDKYLKWEEHLNHVRKKILPISFEKEKDAFQPNCANPKWSSASESHLSVLRVLQNKFIKIIKGWRYSTAMLYTQDILPLDVVSEYNLFTTNH